MGSLRELNEKIWYRLIKVLYVFMYLPCLGLVLVAFHVGKDYHYPVYPKTLLEAINDPAFYKLTAYDKWQALATIDRDFHSWDYARQTHFIDSLNHVDIITMEFQKLNRDWEDVSSTVKLKPPPSESNSEIRPADKTQSPAGTKNLVPRDTTSDEWIDVIQDRDAGIQTQEYIARPRKSPLRRNVVERYHYVYYYTQNIWKSIFILLIGTLCYVLVMEIIRRAFYYVALGTSFPKE